MCFLLNRVLQKDIYLIHRFQNLKGIFMLLSVFRPEVNFSLMVNCSLSGSELEVKQTSSQ